MSSQGKRPERRAAPRVASASNGPALRREIDTLRRRSDEILLRLDELVRDLSQVSRKTRQTKEK